jgi:hypothetical protein
MKGVLTLLGQSMNGMVLVFLGQGCELGKFCCQESKNEEEIGEKCWYI